MSFPSDDLCLPLPAIPSIDDICLPGGFCLSYVWDAIGKIPTASDMTIDFFGQIGPALAPLKPLFDVLNTVVALFNCVRAIPQAILTLDPSDLIQCIPALAEAVDNLLKLLPQLSLPKMVKAALHNLATLLRSVAADLSYIEAQLQRIADMIDRATDLNNRQLNGFLVCAQNTQNDAALSTAEALKGIGSIILLLNLLVGLFGGPEIPCFGRLVEDNLGAGFDRVIRLLLLMAEVLDDIAASIPDPDLALTLALGERRC